MKQGKKEKKASPVHPASAPPKGPVAKSTGIVDFTFFEKYGTWLVVSFCVIGAVLRLIKLDVLSLWVDEFVHINTLQDFYQKGASLITDDNNGILYTISMIPFTKIFGLVPFWCRLPAVLFGVGTIWMVYVVGRQLYNNWVGVIAAFGWTISLYAIFWSRVTRNYTILSFFYLVLIYYFIKTFTPPEKDGVTLKSKWGIDIKMLSLLFLAFIAALLSHQLAVFFVFAASIYIAGVGIAEYFWKKNKVNIYTLAAIPLLVMILLLFHPALNTTLRSLLGLFVETRNLDWFLVNWDMVSKQWQEKPYQSWNVYWGVVTYDYIRLWIPGCAGLVLGFFVRKRSAWFVATQLIVITLLLSFIYRDPNLPRYFIFLYPIWWISIGVAFYVLWTTLQKFVFKLKPGGVVYKALFLLPFVLILFAWRFKEVKKLINVEERSGWVTSSSLTKWRFTNWRDACLYVNAHKQPGDVIMSTIPNAVSYYTHNDSVVWFRQNYLDTKTRKYTPHPIKMGKDSILNAQTAENFLATINAHPRGWILADYYLYGPFTNSAAMVNVFTNTHLVSEAVFDGSVILFHWDKNEPHPQTQNFVAAVGTNASNLATPEFQMNMPAEILTGGTVQVVVKTQGIEREGEAFLVLNGQNRLDLPVNKSDQPEIVKIPCPAEALKPGQNKFQFAYEESLYTPGNSSNGYLIYYLGFE